jgi:hypothetical protein
LCATIRVAARATGTAGTATAAACFLACITRAAVIALPNGATTARLSSCAAAARTAIFTGQVTGVYATAAAAAARGRNRTKNRIVAITAGQTRIVGAARTTRTNRYRNACARCNRKCRICSITAGTATAACAVGVALSTATATTGYY